MQNVTRIAACCLVALMWSASFACTAARTTDAGGPIGSKPAGVAASVPGAEAGLGESPQKVTTAGGWISAIEEESSAGAPVVTPEQTALRWLDAVRRADTAALARLSRYPFQLRTTGADVPCTSRTALASDDADVSLATSVEAKSASQLTAVVDCLVNDKLLGDELGNNPTLPSTELHRNAIPSWAHRWIAELRHGAVVLVEVFGDGITYHFILQVDNGGVRSLWKHAEFDSN
jgi:hypothetical protein